MDYPESTRLFIYSAIRRKFCCKNQRWLTLINLTVSLSLFLSRFSCVLTLSTGHTGKHQILNTVLSYSWSVGCNTIVLVLQQTSVEDRKSNQATFQNVLRIYPKGCIVFELETAVENGNRRNCYCKSNPDLTELTKFHTHGGITT